MNLLAVKEGVRPGWCSEMGLQNQQEILDLLGLDCIEYVLVDDSSDSDSFGIVEMTLVFDPQRTTREHVENVLRLRSSSKGRTLEDFTAFGKLLGYPSAGDLSPERRRLSVEFLVDYQGHDEILWGYVLYTENWPSVAVHAEQTLSQLSKIAQLFSEEQLRIKFQMHTIRSESTEESF